MSSEHLQNTTVAFPHAGAGAVIRYRTVELVDLQAWFGGTHEWLGKFQVRVLANEPAATVQALKLGLKQADAKTPLGGLDWNDLPFAMEDAAPVVVDAVLRAIFGTKYAEVIAAQRAAAELLAGTSGEGAEGPSSEAA